MNRARVGPPPAAGRAAPPRAARRRALGIAGATLALAGLGTLGQFVARRAANAPTPYRYRVVAEAEAAGFRELGLDEHPRLPVRKIELLPEGATAAAALAYAAAPPGAAPVLLGWDNRGAEPLLRPDMRAGEIAALARSVRQHVPAGATVLAWPDTSRQLDLLAGTKAVHSAPLLAPLLLPASWRSARRAIEASEHRFWQGSSGAEAAARFARYVDALVAPYAEGLAALRAMIEPGAAHLIVQLSDAYRAGVMRPERFAIGWRDFTPGTQLHGTIAGVKAWLAAQGHRSYAIDARDPAVLRVFFLTDAPSQDTLVARLLPFSTSNPFRLEAPRIVHQQGPYWVYRIAGSAGHARKEEG